MPNPKKKIKKYVAAVILLLILAGSVSGLRIQSVRQYREEQKELVKDIIVADTGTGAAVLAGQGDSGQDAAGTDTDLAAADGTAANTSVSDGTAADSNDAGRSGQETETSGVGQSGKGTEISTDSQRTDAETGKGKNSATDKSTRKNTDKKDSKNHTQPGKKNTSPKRSAAPSKQSNRAKENQNHPKQSTAPLAKATPKPSPTPAGEKQSFICGITIRCDSMLKHMDDVAEEAKGYIPSDGILLGQTDVKVETGDTAYSLLQKVCQAKDIALDASYTNAYASAYVRGIGHIYEKQAGLSSGWLYLVNGKLPGYGASRYRLKEGDQLTWTYSCTGKLE